MSPWTIGWLLLTLAALSSAAGEWFRLPRSRVRRSPPPDEPSDTDDIPDQWITQPLDHFHPTDNNTWEQRYQAVTDHYQKSGPVFLMMGNVRPIDNSTFKNNWLTYAKQYNALMFQLEHRFYGESVPTSDLSVDNLRYLSSQQALADAAYFVTAMNLKYNLPADTKWIVFGGFYAGNLAAWLRYKYPHLIHAAVASSAPVLAKVKFITEDDVVELFTNFFATVGQSCYDAFDKAIHSIKMLLENSEGQQFVHDIFNVSDIIDENNKNDNDRLLSLMLVTSVLQAVLYDTRPEELCDIIANETLGSPVNRFSAIYNTEYSLDSNENDYDLEDKRFRLFRYQTCTEFGHLLLPSTHRRLAKVEWPTCSEEFGEKFTKEEIAKAVYRTNIMYGGLDIKATRVVYVGSSGPWRLVGITKTRIPESPAIFITETETILRHLQFVPVKICIPQLVIKKGIEEEIKKGTLGLVRESKFEVFFNVAFCHKCTGIAQDMNPPTDEDLPALKEARAEVGIIIGKWLKEK